MKIKMDEIEKKNLIVGISASVITLAVFIIAITFFPEKINEGLICLIKLIKGN